MKLIKNLKIVDRILHEKLPNHKFDRLDMLLFSTPKNMQIFFIGNKDDNTKTLFKHSSNDECYYDVLSDNGMYYEDEEKLYELDSDKHCTNLKSLEELSKNYIKRKEVIL